MTGISPKRSIVSMFDRSISDGSSGHGVRTTAWIRSATARAASIVSSEWLIVPRPGRAAMTTGRDSSPAKSRTR